jgi:hypothetical protein
MTAEGMSPKLRLGFTAPYGIRRKRRKRGGEEEGGEKQI